MTARIVDVDNGLVTVRIAGRLSHADLQDLQRGAAELIDHEGPVRLLVFAEDFDGWEQGGDWGDVSFQLGFDSRIEKMAIVGQRKWEDLILAFAGQGLRTFSIEYFMPDDTAKARRWLSTASMTR